MSTYFGRKRVEFLVFRSIFSQSHKWQELRQKKASFMHCGETSNNQKVIAVEVGCPQSAFFKITMLRVKDISEVVYCFS